MKNYILFTFLCLGIFFNAQTVKVVNKKGTELEVDASKWTQAGNNIYNKNTGNIGIGNTNPLAKFHTNGTLRFESLGTNTINTDILTTNASGDVTNRTLSSLLSTSWSLAGNTGTNPANDFIGTTDNTDLIFRSQNAEKMRLFSLNSISALGLGRNSLTGINGGASTFSGPTLFLGVAGNFSSSTGPDLILLLMMTTMLQTVNLNLKLMVMEL